MAANRSECRHSLASVGVVDGPIWGIAVETARAMYAAFDGEAAAKRNGRRVAILADVIATHGAQGVSLSRASGVYYHDNTYPKPYGVGGITILGETYDSGAGLMNIVYATHPPRYILRPRKI